jgi:hypothetical protein
MKMLAILMGFRGTGKLVMIPPAHRFAPSV